MAPEEAAVTWLTVSSEVENCGERNHSDWLFNWANQCMKRKMEKEREIPLSLPQLIFHLHCFTSHGLTLASTLEVAACCERIRNNWQLWRLTCHARRLNPPQTLLTELHWKEKWESVETLIQKVIQTGTIPMTESATDHWSWSKMPCMRTNVPQVKREKITLQKYVAPKVGNRNKTYKMLINMKVRTLHLPLMITTCQRDLTSVFCVLRSTCIVLP